jgi:hypothetical protein
VCGIVAALAAFVALGVGSGGQSGPPKAAIADHLSLTFPDPAFVQQATSMLEEAGYAVDYYPGEQVTVEFYRNLPRQGYELLILRVHSALFKQDIASPDVPPATLERVLTSLADNVFLFTAEPYSEARYREEQVALRLLPVRYYGGSPQYSRYFAIASDFVRSGMKGHFDQSTVVLMGCDGLTFDTTAAAFIKRGAGAVVGWSGRVSADHTDAATERFLQHLVIDNLGVQEAVARTMSEVGPDPSFGSQLLVYPPEAAASAGH